MQRASSEGRGGFVRQRPNTPRNSCRQPAITTAASVGPNAPSPASGNAWAGGSICCVHASTSDRSINHVNPQASTKNSATSGDATSSPTATDADMLADCPEHPQTDACCCFEDRSNEDIFPKGSPDRVGTRSACGLPQLCSPMEFYCEKFELDCEDMTTKDEAALDCVLQALASGASGQVSWYVGPQGGVMVNYVELDLVGDGTLFRQGHFQYDLCWDTHAVQRHSLPAPAYYEGCLAETKWRARFDCLRAAPLGEPLETCIPGSDYTSNQC